MDRVDARELRRAAARGVIAAMAMTGMRRMTRGLGLLKQPPPEEMARDAPVLSAIVARTPLEHRAELIELFHWIYGGVGGAVFGAAVRSRRPWIGPVYGLSVWALFETGIVPLLGLGRAHDSRVVSRVVVALDHVLYGVVVAGEPATPERDARR